MIEGLPGSGKTTTAQLVHEILNEMNYKTELILEGNLDHPADYDGVAYFSEKEIEDLLSNFSEYKDILKVNWQTKGEGYFIPYGKMLREIGMNLPQQLLDVILKKDIYELPFEQNQKLITEKWKTFTQSALKNDSTYIFECNFIQNPVTIGMVKYNHPQQEITRYILALEKTIKTLTPLLIYINQENLNESFRKAVQERPKDWSEGFIQYYTDQAYGEEHNLHGLEGTIEILKSRKELELDIYKKLTIDKVMIDNSAINLQETKEQLRKTIKTYMNKAINR